MTTASKPTLDNLITSLGNSNTPHLLRSQFTTQLSNLLECPTPTADPLNCCDCGELAWKPHVDSETGNLFCSTCAAGMNGLVVCLIMKEILEPYEKQALATLATKQEQIVQAQKSREESDYNTAASTLHQLIQLDPHYRAAYKELSEVYLEDSKFEEAIYTLCCGYSQARGNKNWFLLRAFELVPTNSLPTDAETRDPMEERDHNEHKEITNDTVKQSRDECADESTLNVVNDESSSSSSVPNTTTTQQQPQSEPTIAEDEQIPPGDMETTQDNKSATDQADDANVDGPDHESTEKNKPQVNTTEMLTQCNHVQLSAFQKAVRRAADEAEAKRKENKLPETGSKPNAEASEDANPQKEPVDLENVVLLANGGATTESESSKETVMEAGRSVAQSDSMAQPKTDGDTMETDPVEKTEPDAKDETEVEVEPETAVQVGIVDPKFARPKLDCVLCIGLMVNPLTMKCGHTLCRRCWSRVLDHANGCPFCRTDVGWYLHPSTPNNKQLLEYIALHYPNELKARRKALDVENPNEIDMKNMPIFVCTPAVPGAPCPLRIFEPRYRLMIRRAWEGSRTFGMCAPGMFGEHDFCPYGVTLYINDLTMLPDGESLVSTTGKRRFKVVKRDKLDGYNVGEVEWFDDDTQKDLRLNEHGETDKLIKEVQEKFLAAVGDKLDMIEQQSGKMPEQPDLLSFWLGSLGDPRISLLLLQLDTNHARFKILSRLFE